MLSKSFVKPMMIQEKFPNRIFPNSVAFLAIYPKAKCMLLHVAVSTTRKSSVSGTFNCVLHTW